MTFKKIALLCLVIMAVCAPAMGMHDYGVKKIMPVLASKLFWCGALALKIGVHAIIDYKKNNYKKNLFFGDSTSGDPVKQKKVGESTSSKPFPVSIRDAFWRKSTYALIGIGGLVWWLASKRMKYADIAEGNKSC